MTVELAGPDPVDVHLGRRVRGRRRAMGVTQAELADGLGVSFQQVQKYERGHNRISASTLCRIAWRLQAQIGYFFEGLPDPAGRPGSASADSATALGDAFLASTGGTELAQAFLALKPSVRVAMVALARVASQDAGGASHD